MSIDRNKLTEELHKVSMDYNGLCKAFGKGEVDKHLNNALNDIVSKYIETVVVLEQPWCNNHLDGI